MLLLYKRTESLLSATGPLLNKGIMCSRVHWKFAAEIMKKAQSCGLAQDSTLNSSTRPRVISVVGDNLKVDCVFSYCLLLTSKCLLFVSHASSWYVHASLDSPCLSIGECLQPNAFKKQTQRKDTNTSNHALFHKNIFFSFFKNNVFFIFPPNWLTVIFHSYNTQRCCTMAGRNKPEGRLMPWIPTWLSVGARRVICISPSRAGALILARQHCARGGTVASAVAWTTDRWITGLSEYGEGEKTKEKGRCCLDVLLYDLTTSWWSVLILAS